MNTTRALLAVLALGPLLVGTVFAQSGIDDFSKPSSEQPTKKSDMPTVEEAAAIKSPQIPLRFPRLMAQIRVGFFNHQLESLESGFQEVIDGYGAEGSASLDSKSMMMGFTLRLQLSQRFGVWADAISGGQRSNTVDTSAYLGILGFYTLTSPNNPEHALMVGAGVGQSRMTVNTPSSFSLPLESPYTLEQIYWRTDWTTVFPLMLTMEFPNSQYNRYAMFLSGLVLFGGTEQGEMELQGLEGEIFTVPMEASLGGWSITIGLLVGW